MTGAELVHVPRAYEDPEQREPNAPAKRTTMAARRVVIAQRREKVADLIRAHVSQREIARVLNVGLGTVGDDVKAIKAMYAERSAEAYEHRVAEEDAKLDFLERIHFQAVAKGEKWASEFYLRLMDRRAKLHGLDQPTRVAARVTVEHTTTLDAEIERLMAEHAGAEQQTERQAERDHDDAT